MRSTEQKMPDVESGYGHKKYCREKCVCRCSEHRRCIAAGVAGPVNRPRPYTEKGRRPYDPGDESPAKNDLIKQEIFVKGGMKMRKRNTGINIRVTEPEKKTINENARCCNLTVSEYLRKLAMEHEPRELPKKEIYEEMVSLDRKIRMLLSEAVPIENTELQQKYLHELQDLRDIMNRIWMLLMANYDTGKTAKKGTAGHGND